MGGETKHTPGPWGRMGLTVYALEEDRDRRGRSFLGNRFWASLASGPNCPREELEANADLIVRAVNSHVELVEALRGLVDPYNHYDDERSAATWPRWCRALDAARAAIAKATGEGS